MTKSNFFNLLTLADKERVQSAVIAWVLSSDCYALTSKAREIALKDLFNIKNDEKWENFTVDCHLEWQNIDILFVVRDDRDVKYVLVVENKVKSGLHDNQLNRYKRQIECNKILQWKKNNKDEIFTFVEKKEDNPYYCKTTDNRKFIYLTLLPQEGQDVWANKTYCDLYKILTDALKSSKENSSLVDYMIAQSYCSSLKELVEISSNVMSCPAQIFSTKSNNEYIEANKLRHVLQHYYFKQFKKENEERIKEYIRRDNVECSMRVEYGIQQSEAEVVLDISSGELVDKYLAFNDGKKGEFAISFQSNSFKISIVKDYNDTENHEQNVRLLRDKRMVRFPKEEPSTIFDDYKKNNSKWSVNCPKGGYPRMSMSIKQEKLLEESIWSKSSNKEIMEALTLGFMKCFDTLKDMLDEYVK